MDHKKMIGKNLRKIMSELLLMLHVLKKKKIYPTNVSKYNSNLGKQFILLMISNREKQHYPAVKMLSGLLRGTTSKNNGDSYCLNCLHSFRKKNRLESHKKVCEIKDFCNVIMPSEDTKTLELNQNLIKQHLLFMKILSV